MREYEGTLPEVHAILEEMKAIYLQIQSLQDYRKDLEEDLVRVTVLLRSRYLHM